MKRILFFIPSLVGGGAEKVLVNLVNNIDKTKFEVTLLSLFDGGVNKQFLRDDVIYKSIFKKSFRGNIHLFKLFSPRFLYDKMIKDNYDVVVSYLEGPTTRIVAGCPHENVKLVQWVHNEYHNKRKIARCYRSVKESVSLQKRFDANIYVANTVKDIYLKTFPELDSGKAQNLVIYNVVESDTIIAKANEPVSEVCFDKDKINLVTVGRLVPQKSFDRLLNVIHRLKEETETPFHLYILGDGELRTALEEQRERLGLNSCVTFLGYNPNPYKFVKNADLFVCSSLHEGFSTAVTESLIVGTPVVTTLCSGMAELLGDNEYGVITENNEQSLFDGLVDILNQEKLKHYKVKAKEKGTSFNKETTVKAAENFLAELVK